jgi:hypothetical protein
MSISSSSMKLCINYSWSWNIIIINIGLHPSRALPLPISWLCTRQTSHVPFPMCWGSRSWADQGQPPWTAVTSTGGLPGRRFHNIRPDMEGSIRQWSSLTLDLAPWPNRVSRISRTTPETGGTSFLTLHHFVVCNVPEVGDPESMTFAPLT